MKITKSRLKEIVREEIQAINEIDFATDNPSIYIKQISPSRKEIRLLFDGKIDGMTAAQPIAIAHYMLKHWLESDTRSS